MSLTSGTSNSQSSTSRPIPANTPSSASRETSSSSTSSVSASASGSSRSLSPTTTSTSTGPANRVPSTTQSLSESSTTSQTNSLTTLSWTSTSQSSVSRTSTTTSQATSITTTTTSSGPSSTITPPPSTRHHGPLIEVDSTSSVTVSSSEASFTSQTSDTRLSQSTSPTTTSEPGSTVTPAPGTYQAVHRLIIDLGDCAGFTSPRLLLERGELGDLVAIGTGRFAIEMKTELSTEVFGLVLSLKDDGVRCGNGYTAACTSVELSFGVVSGVTASVLRAGDYGVDMYPFSMWMEDGVTWGAQLANSTEQMYNCWGWSQEECPYAFANGGDAGWTVSSENPTGLVYVGFCPSDGPKWSQISQNPNAQSFEPTWQGTYIILPTQTIVSTSTFLAAITPTETSTQTQSDTPRCDGTSTCILHNTFISEDVTSTVWSKFITPPAPSTILFSTAIVQHATSTVAETTLLSKPTPTTTSLTVKSTDVETSSGHTRTRTRRPTTATPSESDISISTSTPTVVPTYSAITNSLGSVVSTLSYNATVSPAPTTTSAPDSQYIITSWTTWMTVNGSTVPAIAGEVGVLSTIPITYMLEPSTTIPVAEISSRSVESTRTSSPSPSTAASSDDGRVKSSRGGKIAGAIVGALVGLALGSLLLWYVCYRRRRRQRRDYFARGDPAWLSPRHDNGSGGGSRLLVDLDEEPRMRNSYIEPWVPPRSTTQSSRGKASQPEMEGAPGGYGASTMAVPTREHESSSNEGASSWFQHESSDTNHVFASVPTRSGKSITRSEPTRRPDVAPQRPAPSHYRTPSLANPSMSLLPTPFQNEPPSPFTPPSPLSGVAMMPNRVSPPPRAGPSQRRYVDDEQIRHDAIPPLYNEAWNTGR